MPGREGVERNRRGEHRDAAGDRAEDCEARLPGDEEGERGEHGRLTVEHDGGVEARDLRHESEEPVPEREGVAGVEAAVDELVDGAEMEVAELDELSHPGLVEERIAGHRAFDMPERETEHHPDDTDGTPHPGDGIGALSLLGRRERLSEAADGDEAGGDPDPGEDRRCEPDRAVDGEDDRPGQKQREERPGEGRGRASLAECPRNEEAREQDDAGREREPEILADHERSAGTFPDSRNLTPSR